MKKERPEKSLKQPVIDPYLKILWKEGKWMQCGLASVVLQGLNNKVQQHVQMPF